MFGTEKSKQLADLLSSREIISLLVNHFGVGIAVPLLLLITTLGIPVSEASAQITSASEDTSLVIGGHDVEASQYNRAIGLIVGSLQFPAQTLKGGATVIDSGHILAAAHVLTDIQYGSIYYLPCRVISSCNTGDALEISEVISLDPANSDWVASQSHDVAIGILDQPTSILPVTLTDATTAYADPIFVRGHGCISTDPFTYPDIQKEAGITGIEVAGNEIIFHDSDQRTCFADSGTFGGVKRNGIFIQTGIAVRSNPGISVFESIHSYRSWINDCRYDNVCPGYYYQPPDEEILLGDVVTDDIYLLQPGQNVLAVPAPGILANDKDRVSIYSLGNTRQDRTSLVGDFSTGGFTFYLNGERPGEYIYYYYACDTNLTCESANITFATIDSKVALPLISR